MSVFSTIANWFGHAPSDPNQGSQYAMPITAPNKTSKNVTFDSAMTLHRHIGGLENVEGSTRRQRRLHRHIGGLER